MLSKRGGLMYKKRTWVDFLRIFYRVKEPISIRKYVSFLEEALKGRTTFQHIGYFLRLKETNPQLYKRIRTAFEKSNPTLFKQFKVIERYHRKNPSAILIGTFDVQVVAYKDYLNDPIISLSEKREILSFLQAKAPLVYCDLMQELQQKQPQLLQQLKEKPLPIKDEAQELFAARMAYLEQERQFSQKKQLLSDVEVKDGVIALSYMMDRLSQQNPPLYKQLKQEFLNNKELQTPLNLVFDKTKTDKEKQMMLASLKTKNPLVYQQLALLLVNANSRLSQKFGLQDLGMRLEDIAYLKDRRMLQLYLVQSDKKIPQKQAFLKQLEQNNPKLYQMVVQDMMQRSPKMAKALNVYTPKYIYSEHVKTTIGTVVEKLSRQGRQSLSLSEKRNLLKDVAKKDPEFYKKLTTYLVKVNPVLFKEIMRKEAKTDGVDINIQQLVGDGVEIASRQQAINRQDQAVNNRLQQVGEGMSNLPNPTPVLKQQSGRG